MFRRDNYDGCVELSEFICRDRLDWGAVPDQTTLLNCYFPGTGYASGAIYSPSPQFGGGSQGPVWYLKFYTKSIMDGAQGPAFGSFPPACISTFYQMVCFTSSSSSVNTYGLSEHVIFSDLSLYNADIYLINLTSLTRVMIFLTHLAQQMLPAAMSSASFPGWGPLDSLFSNLDQDGSRESEYLRDGQPSSCLVLAS